MIRCSHCAYFQKRTNRGGECHKLYLNVIDTKNNTPVKRYFTVMKRYYCKLFETK
jgi:hypothetical protein